MRRRAVALMLTCEHASNSVPPALGERFRAAGGVLRSHRGWDPGALALARRLGTAFGVPVRAGAVSRLVIDLNRSLSNRSVFSERTRGLSAEARAAVVELYYRPHRDSVDRDVARLLERGRRVLHVGVHTFTPVLRGIRRTADIGVLYDPRRAWERGLAVAWAGAISNAGTGLRVRRNYPYRGASDGLTTSLRRRFPAGRYAGIELEVNQAIATDRRRAYRAAGAIIQGLRTVLSGAPHRRGKHGW